MCLVKVAIGISLLRIKLSKRFTWVIYACIVVSVLVNLTVLAQFSSCTPTEKIWNPSIEGTCWPRSVSVICSYVQTGGNIITDLIVSLRSCCPSPGPTHGFGG
jgi:hypothetical protein